MNAPASAYLNALQRRVDDRSATMRDERQTIVRQRKVVFWAALFTALIAVGLVLYGLALVLEGASLGTAGLTSLSGFSAGIVSGGFGWLAKYLHARQRELDSEALWEAKAYQLMVYALLINNQKLRNETVSHIVWVLAFQLYRPLDSGGALSVEEQSAEELPDAPA